MLFVLAFIIVIRAKTVNSRVHIPILIDISTASIELDQGVREAYKWFLDNHVEMRKGRY